MLATGSTGVARVRSLVDGHELCEPLVHLADPTGMGGLCFSPNGQYLLTAKADRRARVGLENRRTGLPTTQTR